MLSLCQFRLSHAAWNNGKVPNGLREVALFESLIVLQKECLDVAGFHGQMADHFGSRLGLRIVSEARVLDVFQEADEVSAVYWD